MFVIYKSICEKLLCVFDRIYRGEKNWMLGKGDGGGLDNRLINAVLFWTRPNFKGVECSR